MAHSALGLYGLIHVNDLKVCFLLHCFLHNAYAIQCLVLYIDGPIESSVTLLQFSLSLSPLPHFKSFLDTVTIYNALEFFSQYYFLPSVYHCYYLFYNMGKF